LLAAAQNITRIITTKINIFIEIVSGSEFLTSFSPIFHSFQYLPISGSHPDQQVRLQTRHRKKLKYGLSCVLLQQQQAIINR
jgi:hypothetical protein